MRNRLKFGVPAAVAVLAVALWWVLRNGGDRPRPLEASGTVEATTADLGFQLPGRLASVSVQEGDEVAAGIEIASLDLEEIGAQAEAARAQLAAAEARLRELRRGGRTEEVARAEAALDAAAEQEEEARREGERARRLFEGGAIARQELDRAETRLRVAVASTRQAREALALVREGAPVEAVEAQEAVVRQARAQVTRVEASLRNGVIHAPFAGVVTERHREPGETVPAGAPVLTLLDRSDRWVRIYVPEDAVGRVDLGQEAEIRADTWPDRVYQGRVYFIGSEAEFTPRNVQTPEERTRLVYPVKVRITGDDGFELKPGIPADVVLLEASTGSGAGDAG
ncbi:MAG: HlyD family efflux transporter periplasmic adaptor subunit [Gemmatimonadota bacterium]|jgi:HlyD family secretion protein